MATYIVTRHAGAIQWLLWKGYSGDIVPHWNQAKTAQLNPGDLVVGTLPLHMIPGILGRGAEFLMISLPGIALAQREESLTPAEMEAAGAKLYRISALSMEEVA